MYVFRKRETDLAEVKSKYYSSNRNRISKGVGTGSATAKTKVFEKKKFIQEAIQKEKIYKTKSSKK
jgi:hypothetical protein